MTTSDEYLELRLMNNTKEPIDAKIRNERMFPIINTTNHYTMSVVRFDAGNTKVPIFIPEVKRPNHDLAYDDNDNLRNLFNNQPVVLKPFNGVNIQQSGKFDIYGDYIAMVSTNKRYKKRTPGSFLETTIDNTNPAYKVGVWNRHTGDCLWVYDLSNLQIASSTVGGANYAGTFFSVVGCRFSNDGANLIIFVSYTLFSEGSMAGRYLHYVQLPATTGGTLGTVSFQVSAFHMIYLLIKLKEICLNALVIIFLFQTLEIHLEFIVFLHSYISPILQCHFQGLFV